jgi:hypothetical protein
MKQPLWVFILILFAISITCLLFPRTVRSYVIKVVDMGLTSRIEASREYVASDRYLIHLRVIGLGALVMALFSVFVEFRNG